jgi:hypothetical protein
MKLYEVIFYGSHGDGNAEDTIYLVRANTFPTAVELASAFARPEYHNGERFPEADVVHEIGTDSSLEAGKNGERVLRGPYFFYAYNYGWKYWERKLEGKDWEEVRHEPPTDSESKNNHPESMKLYEVLFLDRRDRDRDREVDTSAIFLIRTTNLQNAVALAGGARRHNESFCPHTAFEIGNHLTELEVIPRVLRGPYYERGINFGWRKWSRKGDPYDTDSSKPDIWEEAGRSA